jgi:hypothetical protein
MFEEVCLKKIRIGNGAGKRHQEGDSDALFYSKARLETSESLGSLNSELIKPGPGQSSIASHAIHRSTVLAKPVIPKLGRRIKKLAIPHVVPFGNSLADQRSLGPTVFKTSASARSR